MAEGLAVDSLYDASVAVLLGPEAHLVDGHYAYLPIPVLPQTSGRSDAEEGEVEITSYYTFELQGEEALTIKRDSDLLEQRQSPLAFHFFIPRRYDPRSEGALPTTYYLIRPSALNGPGGIVVSSMVYPLLGPPVIPVEAPRDALYLVRTGRKRGDHELLPDASVDPQLVLVYEALCNRNRRSARPAGQGSVQMPAGPDNAPTAETG